RSSVTADGQINGGASQNIVQGNTIGLKADGSAALANGADGVLINNGYNNTIGDSAPGTGNVISGNAAQGVEISGALASFNVVQGNRIGTDPAGTAARPNAQSGVEVDAAANRNSIGGTVAAARNVISGNTQNGVYITG